jgi:hypothetical protein
MNHQTKKPGDWTYYSCKSMNFASRKECYNCNRVKNLPTTPVQTVVVQSVTPVSVHTLNPVKNGDWICSGCKTHNFANRTQCFGCKSNMKSAPRVKCDKTHVYVKTTPNDVLVIRH